MKATSHFTSASILNDLEVKPFLSLESERQTVETGREKQLRHKIKPNFTFIFLGIGKNILPLNGGM
jgi:hypothetical protein